MKPHINILLFVTVLCGFYNSTAQTSKNYWQKTVDNKYICAVKITELRKEAYRVNYDTIRYSIILQSNKPKVSPNRTFAKKIWADGRAYYYNTQKVLYRYKDTGVWQATSSAVKRGKFSSALTQWASPIYKIQTINERLKDIKIDSSNRSMQGNSKYKSDLKWDEIIFYNPNFLRMDSLIELFAPNEHINKNIYRYEYIMLDSNIHSSQFGNMDFFKIAYPKGTQRIVLTDAPESHNQNYIDSSIASNKLTLIDFWYLSCPPCLKASPLIEKLHHEFNDSGLKVLGINPYDMQIEINNFTAKKKIPYTCFANKSAVTKYNIKAFPTILLIDKKGNILFRTEGLDEEAYDMLFATIKKYSALR